MDTTRVPPLADQPSVVGSLHLLCGKMASGKSTLAQQLASKPHTVLISEDSWLAQLYPDMLHSLADYVRFSGHLRNVMTGHVVLLLKAGVSVVLDFPSNTPQTRAWARTVFESAGAPHYLHYLDVPDETCRSRLHARNRAGEHPFQATDEQFDAITRHFVAPTPEEGLEVVRHG